MVNDDRLGTPRMNSLYRLDPSVRMANGGSWWLHGSSEYVPLDLLNVVGRMHSAPGNQASMSRWTFRPFSCLKLVGALWSSLEPFEGMGHVVVYGLVHGRIRGGVSF